MKIHVPLLLASAVLALTAASAQEKAASKTSTKDRKTMTFQPGAKTPDGYTPPVATPVPVAPAVPVAAAPGAGIDEPGQAAGTFFSSLQNGQIDEAYATLTKGSKIGESPEELQTLKAKTTEAIQAFGAIQGYELLETKAVGANLMRRTYLSLGRDFPLRWRFYFYRTIGQWRLVDLRVDDRLSGMFDEQEESRAPEPKTP